MNTVSEENLQDPYLNDLRKRHQPVVIYLMTGTKFVGVVESFDRHVLSLRKGASSVLIYKHTIASMMPAPKAASSRNQDAVDPEAGRSGPKPVPVIIRKSTRRLV